MMGGRLSSVSVISMNDLAPSEFPTTLCELLDLGRETCCAGDISLLCGSGRAMATLFEVVIPFGVPRAGEAAATALDLIDDLEDQLTVYRDHSEICTLNRRAPFEDVAVESRLFNLLVFARQLTRQ